MLVLSRYKDEYIVIGDHDCLIKVMVVAVDPYTGKVRLGIEAPADIPVHRSEVYEAIQRERKQ